VQLHDLSAIPYVGTGAITARALRLGAHARRECQRDPDDEKCGAH
jgi:hypothetical protein